MHTRAYKNFCTWNWVQEKYLTLSTYILCMQEHISIHLAANHSCDQSNKENVFLTLLRWAVQGKGIRGSLSSLRTYIFHVLLLHILGDFCAHTAPSYHQWVTVAPKFPLLYLWENPLPSVAFKKLGRVSSIPWQVSLWPQWSKLHLRLSPKHISLSGNRMIITAWNKSRFICWD